MNIAKGLRGLFRGERKALGLPYPQWSLVGGMWVQMTDSGAKYIDEAFKATSYVHSIVSHIADKASDAPGGVYRVKDKQKAKAYFAVTKGRQTSESFKKAITLKAQAFDLVDGHHYMGVIENPNPTQTGKQLRRELFGYTLVTGNAYRYDAVPGVGMNGGLPKQQWIIPSPCVEIVTSGNRSEPVKGYKVAYFTEDILDEHRVMHMKMMNLVSDIVGNNWLYGMSPLQAGRATLGQMKAAATAQGTLFQNMGPLGIISGDGTDHLNEETAVGIQDKFTQSHTGILNGGKIVVTPADVKFTEIGISPVDLNIIEGKADLLQELCALYHYPKERITGSQNTASQGLADKQVITSCVMPLLRDYDDSETKHIRRVYNDDSLVYISDTQYFPELQEDRKDLSEWLSKAWWIKVNEKRRAMDYDEDPDGDVMLVPSGLVKLEDAVADLVDPDIDMLDAAGALDGNNQNEDEETN